MSQDAINSYVSAGFYIFSDKLDFDEVNSLMSVANSSIRTRDSFCIDEFAKDYWNIDIESEPSEDINCQLNKLLILLDNKRELINAIRKKFNAECGFVIVITLKDKDISFPAIYYEKEFVTFAASIEASINMDFILLDITRGEDSII